MKVAVVCAYPAGSNSGMISVDLAFETVKKYVDADIEFTRFCAWKSVNHGTNILTYTKLEDISQLLDFDKIIYWGDFLHWIKYGNDWIEKTQSLNKDLTREEIVDTWYQLYFLERYPELQKKAIMFGGTIYGLNSQQLLNDRYFSALKNLYSNASLVLMRDILSSNFVNQLTDSRSTNFGCDCALLLDSSDFLDDNIIDNQPILSYSFGRSGENEKLKQLTLTIAEELNLKTIDLEWLQKGASITKLKEKLSIIKQSKIIITDIYHCSINSIRENIPTVCIGKGASRVDGTLSDKKKEIFYLQHLMSNRFFYLENLKNLNSTEIDKIINDFEINEIIQSNLSLQIKKSLNTLIQEINHR
jgi:hypothetical protein